MRLSLMSIVVIFFFFQAEDGIRDVAVTGVQTCALPIFALVLFVVRLASEVQEAHPAGHPIQGARRTEPVQGRRPGPHHGDPTALARRSEERRVGKEWRSRWPTQA